MGWRRRDLLASTAAFLASTALAKAELISGALPWTPNAGHPPDPVKLGPWLCFTPAEAETIEAIADCIIPPDPQTPGGKDCGCAVYVDRQLAGPYGRSEGLYTKPPFMTGTKEQGSQTESGPALRYRQGLAALDRHCRSGHGKPFAELDSATKNSILSDLESKKLTLQGTDGNAFFELVLKDVQQGFFADPIYGGNRDMASWKMIGFPGARYNYLDWVGRHNEPFPLPPVGITGRAEWSER
jgi:gluconate 2-dehydrogenase gamma chain